MTGRRGPRGQSREASGRSERRRAQSEVLGVVLLLAITVVGTGFVVMFGSSALSESRQASAVDSAEHAMAQLDSESSLVGLGSSPVQRTSLGLDGVTVHNRSGRMTVRIVNRTGGATEHVVLNRTLGAVVYRNGDTAIAYQGGGVWKRAAGASTMVSPPEFHYRGTTLTLPLVTVAGSGPVDGDVRMTRDGPTDPRFPRPGNATFRNPLEGSAVNVTVKSEFYEAWGRFFERRTGGSVTYDHASERVVITLVTPTRTEGVTNALAGTTPDRMTIKGAGGSSFTDSYDSSEEPYPGRPTRPYEGTIVTKGGVELTGGAELYGDLRTGGGVVDIGGGVAVHGNISYGGTLDCKGGGPPSGGGGPGGGGCRAVDGWVAGNGTAPDISPVGDLVARKISTYGEDSNNRNDEVTAIDETTDEWNESESTLRLPAGAYYLSEETLDASQTLVFDTSDGDVTLAVDDDIVWNDVNVEVTDPEAGTARIYTSGSTFHVVGGAVGDTATHRSPSLRVYAGPGLDVRLDDHADFVGLVYAPGTDAERGSITVRTHAELFGGVVGGGNTLLQAGGSIHFDQALRTVDPVREAESDVARLTYLHVSVASVNVTSA